MTSTTFIGIDPGQTGAIAVITEGQSAVYDMPMLEDNTLDMKQFHVILYAVLSRSGNNICTIEKQQAFPGQGVSSTFKTGFMYGQLLLALALCLRAETIVVTPTKWKRDMGIPAKSDKEVSRAMAIELFPELADSLKRKKDHGRAEALLIADWTRRTNGK